MHPPDWQALTAPIYELGESPFWHPQEHMLYWVDIPACKVLRSNVYMGEVQTWELPCEPGCIAPAERGGLVLALRDGVYRAQHFGGALQRIARLDYDTAHMRANDGKCDASGRFWIGTLDETKSARNAALFCVDCRSGNAQVWRATDPMQCPVTTANGLAWSPDGRTLYWADTPSHRVQAWDFDPADGTLARPRTFAQFARRDAAASAGMPYGGRPDGATVDAQGNYLVALYEGARLCRYAPDGRLLEEIALPVRCPTMPCLGGEDLCTLYVTTARQGRTAQELAAHPLSGSVLSLRVAVPGLPTHCFVD